MDCLLFGKTMFWYIYVHVCLLHVNTNVNMTNMLACCIFLLASLSLMLKYCELPLSNPHEMPAFEFSIAKKLFFVRIFIDFVHRREIKLTVKNNNKRRDYCN